MSTLDDLLSSRRVSNITRFSLFRVQNKQTVADHSFHVAILAMLIAEDVDRHYKKEMISINKDLVIKLALFHDIEESVIGDIQYHFKNSDEY